MNILTATCQESPLSGSASRSVRLTKPLPVSRHDEFLTSSQHEEDRPTWDALVAIEFPQAQLSVDETAMGWSPFLIRHFMFNKLARQRGQELQMNSRRNPCGTYTHDGRQNTTDNLFIAVVMVLQSLGPGRELGFSAGTFPSVAAVTGTGSCHQDAWREDEYQQTFQ